MKISINPMPVLQEKAEAAVDSYFNGLAAANAQKDQEYAGKRAAAAKILVEGESSAPVEFAAEAQLMSMSAIELASIVSNKPDIVLQRGLTRRTAILSVRNASTPADLNAVLVRYGVPPLER